MICMNTYTFVQHKPQDSYIFNFMIELRQLCHITVALAIILININQCWFILNMQVQYLISCVILQ